MADGDSVKIFGVIRLATALIFPVLCASPASQRFSSLEEYQRYIDPLLQVSDFGIHYYDDGAADATVLFPSTETNPYNRPREPVIALVRLGAKAFPLLIDCLSDHRVTSVRFDGNNIARPMAVPVGYVCLDILIATAQGRPISRQGCSLCTVLAVALGEHLKIRGIDRLADRLDG